METLQAVRPTSRHIGLVYAAVVLGIALPVYNAGALVGLEIFLAAGAPVLLVFALRSPFLTALWAFGFLWSAAQLFSNHIHGAPLLSAPSLIGPSVALLVTGAFWVREQYGATAPLLAACGGAGWSILELVARNPRAADNLWKYSLAVPVAAMLLGWAYHRRWSTRQIALLMFALAAISPYFDARFQTALCALTGVVVLVTGGVVRSPGKTTALLAALVIGVAAVYLVYPSLAMQGLFGERAQLQIEASDSELYLLGARLEFPQMTYLFFQHPGFGVGANVSLNAADAIAPIEFINNHVIGLKPIDIQYLLDTKGDNRGYHAHSAAMSAAFYAGFLALPFWIFLLVRMGRGVARVVRGTSPAGGLAFYLAGLATWDAFFSPLTNRTHISVALALLVTAGFAASSRTNNQDAGASIP